jgi:hypothetical protein
MLHAFIDEQLSALGLMGKITCAFRLSMKLSSRTTDDQIMCDRQRVVGNTNSNAAKPTSPP